MPDEHDDDLEDQDDGVKIRGLRDKAKRTDAAEARAEAAETKVAFLEAGLKLTPLQQDAFLSTFPKDGERTPEAFNAHYAALGYAPAATETEEPKGTPAEEQKALGAMQEATAAAEASEAQVQTLEDRINQAKTPEELDSILANAGMLGMSQ